MEYPKTDITGHVMSGEALRAMRKELGMNRKELCAILGRSESTLYHMENSRGERKVDPAVFYATKYLQIVLD